jgi:hypothetical protein
VLNTSPCSKWQRTTAPSRAQPRTQHATCAASRACQPRRTTLRAGTAPTNSTVKGSGTFSNLLTLSGTGPTVGGILIPGDTVWRRCKAGRLAILNDAAAYFAALREALLLATRQVYIIGWDVNTRVRLGRVESPYDRHHIPNPLVNCYRAADDKWFWLLGLQADRHWPDLMKALDDAALRDDPRFANIRVRREHATGRVAIAIFATKPLAEWTALRRRRHVWAPVQPSAMLTDPQARAGGVLTPVEVAEGQADMVASPADFAGTPCAMPTMAPGSASIPKRCSSSATTGSRSPRCATRPPRLNSRRETTEQHRGSV